MLTTFALSSPGVNPNRGDLMASEATLVEIIATIVEKRRDEPRVSPTTIANEGMKELDPLETVLRGQPLVWIGCNLELRQLARAQLGKRYGPGRPEASATGELFEGLQRRYPVSPTPDSEEPIYVLRDLMSAADVAYNVARLRAEANTKSRHADTLEAWHRNRL
jgi:hypothetical protein